MRFGLFAVASVTLLLSSNVAGRRPGQTRTAAIRITTASSPSQPRIARRPDGRFSVTTRVGRQQKTETFGATDASGAAGR
jgi:hypothetical protein